MTEKLTEVQNILLCILCLGIVSLFVWVLFKFFNIDNYRLVKFDNINTKNNLELGKDFIPSNIPLVCPVIQIYTVKPSRFSPDSNKYYIPIDSYSRVISYVRTHTTSDKKLPKSKRITFSGTLQDIDNKFKKNDWDITQFNATLDNSLKKSFFKTFFDKLPLSISFNIDTQVPETSNTIISITYPNLKSSVWVSSNTSATIQRKPILINTNIKPSLRDLLDKPSQFYNIKDIIEDVNGNTYCRIHESQWDILNFSKEK